MSILFNETFETETDNLPGGWYVECNSNLKMVPAICCGENCIELLSAGNKFLPVIPDVADCKVKYTLSVNFTMTKSDIEGGFAFITAFRYDTVTGRGQALRMCRNQENETIVFEYGFEKRNIFTAEKSKSIPVADAELDKPFEVIVDIRGQKLVIESFGQTVDFEIKDGRGKIAVAREHFFDVLKILAFDIETDEVLSGSKKTFTIPASEGPSQYPIFCDVELEDFGNCMDVSVSVRGGVRETPPGEGTYSGKRMDILTEPYVKVITSGKDQKHIVLKDSIINIVECLGTQFFYRYLAPKFDWPFKRKVRFLKPDCEFNLAFGFNDYTFSEFHEMTESPSETVFDLDGNVLYSGLGITEVTQTELLSQENKEMIDKLPPADPRYEKAVEFVKNNHFFFEGENPLFKVRLTGCNGLPFDCKVTLEDAFLRPVRELEMQMTAKTFKIGVKEFEEYIFTIEELKDLPCGVWHLRFESNDGTVEKIEKCWAFEIMSRQEGALPPPLISGLPFLYDSRTETRGLETDAFDPWFGRSKNAPHYIACANFLPETARKFNVFETVRAYGRKNFLWLAPRCLKNINYADNMDLVNQADYISMTDEIMNKPLVWLYTYVRFVLDKLIEFAEFKKDDNFNIMQLKKWREENTHIDQKTFIYLAENYWEEWLDFINSECHKCKLELLEFFHKTNPRIKHAQYGPAPIYTAKLKGPEMIRVVQNQNADTESDAFWQFEDYPYDCRYDLCCGSYFLGASLMMMPGACIYPEVYVGGGVGYCSDGAVYYAYPPFGRRPVQYPQRMTQRVFEYCYGAIYHDDKDFRFWEKCGFQGRSFGPAWYEKLLKAWAVYIENKPASPVYKAAFVYSDASRRAAVDSQIIVKYPQYRIMDVRNTSTENVPFINQSMRKQGMPQGYQICDENILKLTVNDVSLLVLPTLKGMKKEVIEHIRKLHEQGVALIGTEDVTGLEDIFGVRDSGVRKNITWVRGVNGFMEDYTEFCDDERCTGKCEIIDAKVLIEGEIPVLTFKQNKTAGAAFFNVPPHLVKEDQLHDRFSYSKDGISDFMQKAVAEIAAKLSAPAVRVDSAARVLANTTVNGDIIIPVYNMSDTETVSVVVEIDPALCKERKVTGSCLFAETGKGRYRIRLEPDGCAYLLIK